MAQVNDVRFEEQDYRTTDVADSYIGEYYKQCYDKFKTKVRQKNFWENKNLYPKRPRTIW